MPIFVANEAPDQPCAEMWVDPDFLADQYPDTDPVDLLQVALDATWLMWQLSGQRFHGARCLVEDYDVRRGNGCMIDLRGWPVDEVRSVSFVDICDTTISATGSGTEATGWCRERDSVRLCCGSSSFRVGLDPWYFNGSVGSYVCGCTGNNTVRVQYSVRNNLPGGTERVARRLAAEYVKLLCGKPCSLPERITTVTRQGATWTVLDPQDFLSRGLIGFAPVDQWLSAVNGKGWAQIVDPMRAHLLLNSTVVGCGIDCFDGLA